MYLLLSRTKTTNLNGVLGTNSLIRPTFVLPNRFIVKVKVKAIGNVTFAKGDKNQTLLGKRLGGYSAGIPV